MKKTICITGASAGIGEACAKIFAEKLGDSARLLLMARRAERLQNLAQDIQSQYGCEVLTMSLDVRTRSQVATVFSELQENWKDIDILVNNAGLSRGLSKIQDGDIDDWEEMIDTNIKGLLYVSRAVLPLMVQNQKGTVVNIASIAGREIYPNGNVYCATKSAVRALSEGMRKDVLGTNIRVINIDPGMVETEFSLVRFHGDEARANTVYQGMKPLSAYDVAESIYWATSLPPHVTIADMLIMPTDQAGTTQVFRR